MITYVAPMVIDYMKFSSKIKGDLHEFRDDLEVVRKELKRVSGYQFDNPHFRFSNIYGSRIELNGEIVPINVLEKWSGFGEENRPDYQATVNNKGRYPANTIFDEYAGKVLDAQTGTLTSGKPVGTRNASKTGGGYHDGFGDIPLTGFGDSGGASRFFYCAKASQKDRTENGQIENIHATVKPTTLMTHLIKLVTPPNGINLDICEGSGTSMKACLWLEKGGYKVNHIGFENDVESYETALKRQEINTIKQ